MNVTIIENKVCKNCQHGAYHIKDQRMYYAFLQFRMLHHSLSYYLLQIPNALFHAINGTNRISLLLNVKMFQP